MQILSLIFRILAVTLGSRYLSTSIIHTCFNVETYPHPHLSDIEPVFRSCAQQLLWWMEVVCSALTCTRII